MLSKNFDFAVVGENFLSYVLSLELLRQGQKVLILDHPGLQFGDLFVQSFSSVERSFLKAWGEDRDIAPLINIDDYLTLRPRWFFFDGTRIRLGDSPLRNIREIFRKLPCEGPDSFNNQNEQFFSNENAEQFDRDFEDVCQRIGQAMFRNEASQTLSLKSFLPLLTPSLNSIFELMYNEWGGRKGRLINSKIETLLYMAFGLYQKKLTTNASRFEFFYLVLSMISPSLWLDKERLCRDLGKLFFKNGGEFKRTTIKEWRFHRGRPWSVELASYEGIIHPKKISFQGGIPEKMGISLYPERECFRSLLMKFRISGLPQVIDGDRIIFCDKDKVGTFAPLWEAEIRGDFMMVKIFVERSRGFKINFQREKLEAKFIEEIKSLFPLADVFDGHAFDVKLDNEVWLGEKRGSYSSQNEQSPLTKKMGLLETSLPGLERPLKNVYYFGPYKGGALGRLSSLMEIKDNQKFM